MTKPSQLKPKQKPKPKSKVTKRPDTWGAGDPNYLKDMVARGKAARKAREDAKQGIYVNPTYGPISGSATE
jgi:hypothetical protein